MFEMWKLSKKNYKKVYPQFVEQFQSDLTRLKCYAIDLENETRVFHKSSDYPILFELAFEKECKMRRISEAFERAKKAFPDNYEQDLELVQMNEELNRYLCGINYFLNSLTTSRKIFHYKQYEKGEF